MAVASVLAEGRAVLAVAAVVMQGRVVWSAVAGMVGASALALVLGR